MSEMEGGEERGGGGAGRFGGDAARLTEARAKVWLSVPGHRSPPPAHITAELYSTPDFWHLELSEPR